MKQLTDYLTQELFRRAKDSLDIKEVARAYGLYIDHSGKALCPFHQDRHPSLSFKGQMFKCFSCNTGGDVFTLAGKLLGISKPIDVLKQLNIDFGLGLELNQSKHTIEDRIKAQEQRKERERIESLNRAFADWVKQALITCTSYAKLLREWQMTYAPKSEGQQLHPLYEESLLNLTRIEYLCECLAMGDRTEQESFYKLCRNEVKAIEQRIRELDRAKAC